MKVGFLFTNAIVLTGALFIGHVHAEAPTPKTLLTCQLQVPETGVSKNLEFHKVDFQQTFVDGDKSKPIESNLIILNEQTISNILPGVDLTISANLDDRPDDDENCINVTAIATRAGTTEKLDRLKLHDCGEEQAPKISSLKGLLSSGLEGRILIGNCPNQ